MTIMTSSLTGKDYVRSASGLPLPEVRHLTCPHYWREGLAGESEEEFTARMALELEQTIRNTGPETIAGFFAEPVIGAGGVIPPPKGYFQAIQPVLRKYGIPLISDEVICGFGRTGKFWGCAHLRLRARRRHRLQGAHRRLLPDGCGHPGARDVRARGQGVGDTRGVAHRLHRRRPPGRLRHRARGAGPAARRRGVRQCRAAGAAVPGRLARLADHPNIGEARGVGLMGALETVADKRTKAAFDGRLDVSERVARQAPATMA